MARPFRAGEYRGTVRVLWDDDYDPQYECAPVHREVDDWDLISPTEAPRPLPEEDGHVRHSVSFVLNAKEYVVDNPDPKVKLADFIRSVGYTGTKLGCHEGGCGICTVLLSFPDPVNPNATKTIHANSCLRLLGSVDGMVITTTEGLGSSQAGFHKIQNTIAEANGSQCGYCTPGWVMAMSGLLAKNPNPTKKEIDEFFDGNICRCTGYRPILQGFQSFAKDEGRNGCAGMRDVEELAASLKLSSARAQAMAGSEGVCPSPFYDEKKKVGGDGCHDKGSSTCTGVCGSGPSCADSYFDRLSFTENGYTFHRPTTLAEVHMLKAHYRDVPRVRLVVGNTSIGITKYFRKVEEDPKVFIDINRIPELHVVDTDREDGVLFGAAVSLNRMVDVLSEQAKEHPKRARLLAEVAGHLNRISSNQVRNVGSWTGNLMIAYEYPNFASDGILALAGIGAILTIQRSARRGDEYHVEVRDLQKIKLGTTDVIVSVFVPYGSPRMQLKYYKAAARHRNAHAAVNAGFSVVMDDYLICKQFRSYFGGVHSGLFQPSELDNYLIGRPLNCEKTLSAALRILSSACTPIIPQPEYQLCDPDYLRQLCLSFFYKFILSLQPSLPPRLASAAAPFVRPVTHGVQEFPAEDPAELPLSKAMPKIESHIQASGEAVYTDDIGTKYVGPCLNAAYVYSTCAKGKIQAIDAAEALAMPGVVDFVCARDVKAVGGVNECGSFPGDEEVFAANEVKCVGQSIGLIVADTPQHAREAAKKVRVEYEKADDAPILEIRDAIAKKSFLEPNEFCKGVTELKQGDVEKGFAVAKYRVQGESMSKPQYHFAMETQACVAVPEENGCMTVYSSAQGPANLRALLGKVLKCPAHKLNVVTKRVGGAFGCKITRCGPVAAAVTIAAKKLGKPIKMQLDRITDMEMMGSRHGQICFYDVGFDETGKVLALKANFYNDGGYCYDSSLDTLSMCMNWADNCYYFPNYHAEGHSLRTNKPTPTSMRAPGAAQAIFNIECIMDHIASVLKIPGDVVRERNFYKGGETTPYGQKVPKSPSELTLRAVWDELRTKAKWFERRAEVEKYNRDNKWRKRGIAITPVKYGIAAGGFGAAAAIDILSEDGTIQATTSGIEVGQGLITKVAQTIAFKLGVPLDMIVVTDTSTRKIPNFQLTGGSVTSEACVAAALKGCDELLERLKPYMHETNGKKKEWKQAVADAAGAGVNLSSTAFHQQAPLKEPNQFDYYVFCAGITEVEIDILTGEMEILRVDIMYDGGIPLNPAIDLGQIEGSFVQGIGMMHNENYIRDTVTGMILSQGTFEYKPPQSDDIPIEFNVAFLKGVRNPVGIQGSKASGEPPVMLAISVLLAAKQAIYYARDELYPGEDNPWFQLDAPAAPERIQLLCGVRVDHMNMTEEPIAILGAVPPVNIPGGERW